jgi:hypothetical protein
MELSALPYAGVVGWACLRPREKGERLLKSKRTLLAVPAVVAVAAAGTWGAVAMAASKPGTTTPKSQTAPKSQSTPHHNCPHMGSSSGASSNGMYSNSNV